MLQKKWQTFEFVFLPIVCSRTKDDIWNHLPIYCLLQNQRWYYFTLSSYPLFAPNQWHFKLSSYLLLYSRTNNNIWNHLPTYYLLQNQWWHLESSYNLLFAPETMKTFWIVFQPIVCSRNNDICNCLLQNQWRNLKSSSNLWFAPESMTTFGIVFLPIVCSSTLVRGTRIPATEASRSSLGNHFLAGMIKISFSN